METKLGKIDRVDYGLGGYQQDMIGIHFSLSGRPCWSTSDFWGAWDQHILPPYKAEEKCKWTESSRLEAHGNNVMRIGKLLNEVKVCSITELEGTPIEVTFDDDGKIDSWRVLTEVL